MAPIADVARGKWRSILPQLGVDTKFLTGKHGPCPVPSCGGKDRFRFTDYQQSGGHVCNACGKGDGVELLCKVNGWSFSECAAAIREIAGEITPDAARPAKSNGTDASRRLWEHSRPIGRNDLAAQYLRSRRLVGPFGHDLRFVAACAVTNVEGVDRLPAMVALVRDPVGQPALVHRTYLGPTGKAEFASPRRMMAGTIPQGSAIRLMPYSDRLGIAEGIETALAVCRDFGIPCWSASNAQMLAGFAWPVDIAELHIFGDNDRKYGGQAAAFQLAHRVSTARAAPVVEVHIPPRVGDDWLDHGNRQLERSHAA